MNKFFAAAILVAAVMIVAIGCTSPSAKAQKLYDEGKYEEVIAQYDGDPNMAAIVAQSKEKLAEKMLAEGKYAAVIELYPTTAAAKAAQDKLAEQLFTEKNYAEVVARYPESKWAALAKAEMDKEAANTAPAVQSGNEGASKPAANKPADNTREQAATAEFERIMAIRMQDMRVAALRKFVADPQYSGTKAQAEAQKELNK